MERRLLPTGDKSPAKQVSGLELQHVGEKGGAIDFAQKNPGIINLPFLCS